MGAVVGSLAGLGLSGAVTVYVLHRRRQGHRRFLLDVQANPLIKSTPSPSLRPPATPSDSYTLTPQDVKVDPFSVDIRKSAQVYYNKEQRHNVTERGQQQVLGVPYSAIMSSSSVRPHDTTDVDGTRIFFGASDLQFSTTIPHDASDVAPSSANTNDMLLIEKNVMINNEMRDQINNLRQDMERMRAETALNAIRRPLPVSPRSDAPPPQYVPFTAGSQAGSSHVGASNHGCSRSGRSQMGSNLGDFDLGSEVISENSVLRPNRRKG